MRGQHLRLSQIAGFVVVALTVAACGGDTVNTEKKLQNVRFDVGGAVVYGMDTDIPLEGVAIEIADTLGNTYSATTNADGLWQLAGLPPGVYAETYTLTGYDVLHGQFALEAQGENDIGNIFVSRGTILLMEEGLIATLSAPFGISVEDGDTMTNGIGGAELEYSNTGDSFITVTFNKSVYSTNVVYLQDGVNFGTIYAQPNQDKTTWTFSKASIDGMNGNLGLTADLDPFTLHTITINNALGYTDIHGDPTTLSATMRFDCVP